MPLTLVRSLRLSVPLFILLSLALALSSLLLMEKAAGVGGGIVPGVTQLVPVPVIDMPQINLVSSHNCNKKCN